MQKSKILFFKTRENCDAGSVSHTTTKVLPCHLLSGLYLHPVSLSLFVDPFRSILSQGPYSLHMWTFPYQEEEAIAYQADKLSTATNPDIVDSMAISFLLDHYSFPVVLPSGFCQPESSDRSVFGLNSTKSAVGTKTTPTLSKAKSFSVPDHNPHTDSVRLTRQPTVTGTSSDCLKSFRENIIRYSLNLPHYLRNVDWVNRTAVDEIHWLLRNCTPRELDLTVALELISIDFPDLTVRKLAVQRLESLSNDEVLKYLLQLVQVCECYWRKREHSKHYDGYGIQWLTTKAQ